MEMKREEVYRAIDSERDYQEAGKASAHRPDMVTQLGIQGAILAMEYNLELARQSWYQNAAPHKEAMTYLRKVAALVVQAAEEFGMPSRPVEGSTFSAEDHFITWGSRKPSDK